MRKLKFTDNQIMDAVHRVNAGFALPDIFRELGISTATFYKWLVKLFLLLRPQQKGRITLEPLLFEKIQLLGPLVIWGDYHETIAFCK